jgi:hypothetical protein
VAFVGAVNSAVMFGAPTHNHRTNDGGQPGETGNFTLPQPACDPAPP